VARNIAKRASRPNPREERNTPEYRRKRDNIVNFDEAASKSYRRKKVELLPRNLAQENYLDLLENPDKNIVIAMGPAGTGKTLLATLFAIQELQAGNVEKIIVTRPLVATGENIGALPGDLIAKLSVWAIPILDIFKEYYSIATVKKLLEDETLELASLGLMRGRSLKNAIVIGDEMQNGTPDQFKNLLTRISDVGNTKMIITGDINQHDRGFAENGLKDFVERLEKNPNCANRIGLVKFSTGDVERHPVIAQVLKLYGEN
jgi:phosphate starvation-inducible PhoH-like protein